MSTFQSLAKCISLIRTNAFQMRKGADEKQIQALDRIEKQCDDAGMYLRGLERSAKAIEGMSITMADISAGLYGPPPVDPDA